MRSNPLHVLVVGQTPPPFGGQAIMIAALLDSRPVKVRLFHVRLRYSDDMDSVGKFALRKVWILFATIVQVWAARFRFGTPMLYYPPSGPNKVPVLRDIIFLCATRWLFRYTVFHYHAGGVSGYQTHLPGWLRPFFKLAYRKADMAIRTAPQNPEDGKLLGARHDIVVPNGITDARGTVPERSALPGEPIVILFTGVLIPSKGVRDLLFAFHTAVQGGMHARLELMGRWGDEAFREECIGFVSRNGLEDRVDFIGVKRDQEKLAHFAECDIFCFPSFFEAESFGLVLLEAMQFAKPVVATRWRGIPSVVEDGENGFLVEVNAIQELADRLMQLAADRTLRERMGKAGRRIFASQFTLERFQQRMEAAFIQATTRQA